MLIFKAAGALTILTIFIFASRVNSKSTIERINPRTLYDQDIKLSRNSFSYKQDNQKELVADTESNKDWWNWSYNNRLLVWKKYDSRLTKDFYEVTEGYGNNPKKSLNKVCNSFYTIPSNLISLRSDNVKDEIERFCTISGKYNSLVVLN